MGAGEVTPGVGGGFKEGAWGDGCFLTSPVSEEGLLQVVGPPPMPRRRAHDASINRASCLLICPRSPLDQRQYPSTNLGGSSKRYPLIPFSEGPTDPILTKLSIPAGPTLFWTSPEG